MTEHSCTDNIEHLPNWHEQLIFAEELNESMLAGCTGYIYWYMRAHWAFVGTGETKYNVGTMKNTKNKLLPRAYVLSHFSKHVTGSTRLATTKDKTSGEGAALEYSAYIKGDSLIVMAIDTIKTSHTLTIVLPAKVKSGTHLRSTGNETDSLCQETVIEIPEPTNKVTVPLPGHSLNTYIFMIDNGDTAIRDEKIETLQRKRPTPVAYYDLHGRLQEKPHGLCVERYADGSSRVIYIRD